MMALKNPPSLPPAHPTGVRTSAGQSRLRCCIIRGRPSRARKASPQGEPPVERDDERRTEGE